MNTPDCPLCAGAGGDVVWRGARARVVLAEEPQFPGFTRVIWDEHRAEMTDLPAAERAGVMALVWCVEQTQRELLRPDKINLASLGNVVAHLHWHVIPRWRDDSHFPAPVWSLAQRDGGARMTMSKPLVARYRAALAERLEALVKT
ncbi:MAG: HIT family protein [Burkholderiaceae bacterium]|nr:HIT family protein [Burkholderiaceae bacterium]